MCVLGHVSGSGAGHARRTSLARRSQYGLLWPPSKSCCSSLQEALPPPMTSGNYQHRNSTCLLHLGFQQAVVAQRGFEWKDEGASAVGASRKWGWVGLEAGAWAEIQVDASTSTEVSSKLSSICCQLLRLSASVAVVSRAG